MDSQTAKTHSPHAIPILRKPEITDGVALQTLVRESEYLDENSLYCYLLVCTQFRNTSIVAEGKGRILGFISAFSCPDRPQVLFIWQVGVHESARKQGLARQMILEILERESCQRVTWLETTVTGSNKASRRLFESVQRHFSCALDESPHFSSNEHFGNQHEAEFLLRIGPIISDNQNG